MKRLASVLSVLMLALFLAACGETPDDSGVKYGGIGDTMSTKQFDFTVTDAYSCDQYRGHLPSEGFKLVVVSMSLKNSCGQPVDVWGDDFVLLWGDDNSASDLDIPLPAGLSDDQLPDEFVLDANASRTGVMVFEAPWEFQDFSIGYMEILVLDDNSDGEEGDSFFVSFTTEDR